MVLRLVFHSNAHETSNHHPDLETQPNHQAHFSRVNVASRSASRATAQAILQHGLLHATREILRRHREGCLPPLHRFWLPKTHQHPFSCDQCARFGPLTTATFPRVVLPCFLPTTGAKVGTWQTQRATHFCRGGTNVGGREFFFFPAFPSVCCTW